MSAFSQMRNQLSAAKDAGAAARAAPGSTVAPKSPVFRASTNINPSTGQPYASSGDGDTTDIRANSAAQSAQRAANAKAQSEGYTQAASWGRSTDASQAYLGYLRGTQQQAAQAGDLAARQYQASQLGGANDIAALGAGYGADRQRYAEPFSAAQQAKTVARQQQASDYLYGVGRGTQPSVAAMQMQQGQEQALASQLALAGSGRGGSSGAMLDQAMRQNAASQQQMAVQGAMQRAQEQQSALQAAAGIDAARYGQQAQSAGIGQQYAVLEAQAAQNALAARSGAYSGGSDIDLAYRGLGRSYEDLVYQQGNEEANRQLSALTGEDAQAFQRSMANTEYARQDRNAKIGMLAEGVGTGAKIYYGAQE